MRFAGRFGGLGRDPGLKGEIWGTHICLDSKRLALIPKK